jgi:cytochrome o ubiquinol oxidase subunit 2
MDWSVLDPKGPVGAQELHVLVTALGLMMIVAVPVIVLTLFFAWRYRASSQTARFTPDWDRSVPIAVVCLLVPVAIVVALAVIAWKGAHELDPYRPLHVEAAGDQVNPIEVQVMALDWKWLFVYPELGVASVNELALPVGVPVHFSITASSVMNAFFIPRLGGMIYAMPRMQTQLSLLASEEGTYEGLSANYSGDGFSDMTFKARALSSPAFDAWVESARRSEAKLDATTLTGLLAPGIARVATRYSTVDGDVFHTVLSAGAQQRPGATRLATADPICTTRGNQ